MNYSDSVELVVYTKADTKGLTRVVKSLDEFQADTRKAFSGAGQLGPFYTDLARAERALKELQLASQGLHAPYSKAALVMQSFGTKATRVFDAVKKAGVGVGASIASSFGKLKSAAGALSGMIAGMGGPWMIAFAGVAAVIGTVIKKIQNWKEAMTLLTESYGDFSLARKDLESFRKAEEEATKRTHDYLSALNGINKAFADRYIATERAINATEVLLDMQDDLAKSNIQRDLEQGNISSDEAERKVREIERRAEDRQENSKVETLEREAKEAERKKKELEKESRFYEDRYRSYNKEYNAIITADIHKREQVPQTKEVIEADKELARATKDHKLAADAKANMLRDEEARSNLGELTGQDFDIMADKVMGVFSDIAMASGVDLEELRVATEREEQMLELVKKAAEKKKEAEEAAIQAVKDENDKRRAAMEEYSSAVLEAAEEEKKAKEELKVARSLRAKAEENRRKIREAEDARREEERIEKVAQLKDVVKRSEIERDVATGAISEQEGARRLLQLERDAEDRIVEDPDKDRADYEVRRNEDVAKKADELRANAALRDAVDAVKINAAEVLGKASSYEAGKARIALARAAEDRFKTYEPDEWKAIEEKRKYEDMAYEAAHAPTSQEELKRNMHTQGTVASAISAITGRSPEVEYYDEAKRSNEILVEKAKETSETLTKIEKVLTEQGRFR